MGTVGVSVSGALTLLETENISGYLTTLLYLSPGFNFKSNGSSTLKC